ncbi:hypothetical protein CDV36_013289 [Fusarium kuroshium]|uniref:Uncharacterized protein n=1 Tax=Fusarium kuroshium TaxID=2010991 RepID=A0A3M2RP69_9HYPO|nr:hypothetical protein CDV36_013289 [Fusarium kuroshium]
MWIGNCGRVSVGVETTSTRIEYKEANEHGLLKESLSLQVILVLDDSKSHQSCPAECDKNRLYVIHGY